jgi:hypoxanthine-guanine phosphoribosyltransferase
MNDLHPDLARVVVSTDQIQTRVKELADQISADFVNGVYTL